MSESALGVRELGVAGGRRAAKLRLAHAVLRACIAVGSLPAWVARGALRRGPILAHADVCAGAPASQTLALIFTSFLHT